jgi:selenocysteine lyase/cysteine desulfurase
MATISFFDEIRSREFGRLEATGSAYFDYTGAALYPASLVSGDAKRLSSSVMGNPHSDNAPSMLSMIAIHEARSLTLQFFDADSTEYEVIFTANASSAIRILADAFPFSEGSRLVLLADNHNSVNGLQLPARRLGADISTVPLDDELRGTDPMPWLSPNPSAPSLFAYPAQSNFSGVKHPLRWVTEAKLLGYRVLLDAAAYAPTNALSLRTVPADFVAVSFYKLFGYPTGVGALIVRKDALKLLRRTYFSGGTVEFVSIQNQIVRLKAGSEAFEDGTPNFLAMPAICDGLKWLGNIGMDEVRNHVESVTSKLLRGLIGLGTRIQVYGPLQSSDRGGTLTFNLFEGARLLDFETVEAAARQRGIAVRGGCFCNPGAAEKAFRMDAVLTRKCMEGAFSVPKFRACLGGAVGAVRASIGVATNMADVTRLIDFLRSTTEGSAASFVPAGRTLNLPEHGR